MPEITIIHGVAFPTGIAVNERREIVVAEHSHISIFTCRAEKVRTFRISSELGQYRRGVTFDNVGSILVTDVWSHCIKTFIQEGKFCMAVGRKGSEELEFDFPAGIAWYQPQ